jgi:hypothetical protein
MGQKLIIIIATAILLITGVLLGYVLSQLVLGYLTPNLLTLLGTFSLIIIFGTLYYVLFWEFRRQQLQTAPATRTRSSRREQQREPDANLKNRLISLTGDPTAAQRLVDQAKQEYPNMPENWYWEKAIADFESANP